MASFVSEHGEYWAEFYGLRCVMSRTLSGASGTGLSMVVALKSAVMDTLHHYEIEWIIGLQKSVSMAKAMGWVSFLGWDAFFVLLPCIYLCFNRRLGGSLFFLYYFSGFVNSLTKLLLQLPRPYWFDTEVLALSKAGSYGLPSGHAQMAVVGWFMLALAVRRPGARLAAGGLVLAISFSRVYLGAHFISDVVTGWALGALVLWLFLWLEPRARRWLATQGLAAWLVLTLVITLGCMGAGWLAAHSVSGHKDPAAWASFAKEARRLIWVGQAAGGLAGAALGLSLLVSGPGLGLRDSLPARLFALGYALTGAYLLGRIYDHYAPEQSEWVQFVGAFARFFLTAWIIAFHAPWVALRLTQHGSLVPHSRWLRHPTFSRLRQAWWG